MLLQGFPFCISGNNLPHTLGYLEKAATVDHKESFMIYGGNGGAKDTIYKYNTDGGQWDEVPNKLSEKKLLMTAIRVKKSLFNQC